MKANEIILGIDFGQTIESNNEKHEKIENPRAMEVIARCVKHCKDVWVVSKVNEKQKQGLLKWVDDHDFYKHTGLTPEKIIFCEERYQKGPICKEIGVNMFIDDRPEVMAHMSDEVQKFLFQPIKQEVITFNMDHVPIVNSWTEIEQIIFGKK
jgi:hypothetical protein